MTNLHALDFLIVDSKNDLNVYWTAAGEGTSCCGIAADKSCCNAEKQMTCCQADSSTPGFQGETSTERDAKQSVASQGIVDFNEWAGTNITSFLCERYKLTISQALSKCMPSNL